MTTLPAPDPALGLFETLLVRAGAPVELDAHLARLGASLAALFGAELPAGLADALRERARELELGRLRVIVRPGSAAVGPVEIDPAGIVDSASVDPASGASFQIAAQPVDPADVFPGPERAAELRSVTCIGGLGPHKWADRSGLEAVSAGALPLLLDRGAEVLEASRANVFVVNRWRLYTPPADGRLLPGTARAAAIWAAGKAGIKFEERALTVADLLGADEVFLTGSIRGIEPARSLDGQPLPGVGAIGDRVAARLRERWRVADPVGASA